MEFFPWAYLEPDQGHYDWTQADRIVTQAENQGIDIIARLGLVPAWARPRPEDTLFGPAGANGQGTTLNYLEMDRFPDFARFVAAFAARYAGKIDHLIIWNEPNLTFEWGYRLVSPADYTELLRQSYVAAKGANPAVTILAAPMAPTLEPEGSPWGLDDLLFLDQMYQAGAAAYFDALAIHTYGFTQPPEADPAPDQLNFRRIELLHTIMVKYGDGNKPVYVTETGWNDNPRWTKAVSPAERVRYTLDSYTYTQAHLPYVVKLCQWVLRYPAPTRSYPDNFTFLTSDFRPRPIYTYLQAYARGWEVP